MNTENKQYRMFNIGNPYLTYCGIESDEDEFENMTECCDELNRLAEENEQLKAQLEMCLKRKKQMYDELDGDVE